MTQPLERALYPFLGHEGVAEVQQLVTGWSTAHRAAAPDSPDPALGLEELLEHLRREIARIIGEGGCAALLRSAVHRARVRAPILAAVHIQGADLDISALRSCRPGDLAAGLAELSMCMLEVLASLIGLDLVEPLIQRVERCSPRQQGG